MNIKYNILYSSLYDIFFFNYRWNHVEGFDPPFDLNFFCLIGGFFSFKIAIVLRQMNDLVKEFLNN